MTSKRQVQRRTGLTLVELMISAVIASILLAGLLGLSASMFKQKGSMSLTSKALMDQKSIYRLIEYDLVNSRFMTFNGTSLELIGYASKSNSGSPSQLPCTIQYVVKEMEGQKFLFRLQSVNDDSSQNRLDIVASETDTIDFLAFDNRNRTWKSLLWSKDHNKRMSIPDVVRVQVFRTDQTKPYLDQIFCLNALKGGL